MGTPTPTQPAAVDKRLRAGDRGVAGGVSLNETHALVLGFSLGVLAGRADQPRLTLALGTALVVPWPREGIGPRTLAREPWWALAPFLVGVVAGQASSL